jgi:plastocyanin
VVSRNAMRLAVMALIVAAGALSSIGTAGAGGGCMHGSGPSDGTGTTVEMVDACFTPTVLHVGRASEVTFVNRDTLKHNVVGVGGTWGAFDELSFGEQASYRFDANGVYLYSCFLHEGMVGAIVVGDGAGAADAAAVHPVRGPQATDTAGNVAAAAVAPGGSTSLGTTAAVVAMLSSLVLAGVIWIALRGRRRRMLMR